jgi:hypothetical protein
LEKARDKERKYANYLDKQREKLQTHQQIKQAEELKKKKLEEKEKKKLADAEKKKLMEHEQRKK